VPPFSSGVSATLEVIDVSGCLYLRSIDFVRSCVKLRGLRMAAAGVEDLSPVAACSETLEELWMARTDTVKSLVPLKACIGLRKLDVRDCAPSLRNQVADLQACTCLADPTSVCVIIEGLVHELQPNMPPQLQMESGDALRRLARHNSDNKAAMTAAGAMPPLVLLLASDSEDVRLAAARTLRNVVSQTSHVGTKLAIAAAGGIQSFVRLLGPGSSEDVQMQAAASLVGLASGLAELKSAIAAAGGIPPLVRLLGPGSSGDVQAKAIHALRNLASNHSENSTAIIAVGAVPRLVQLLQPGSSALVQENAACALRNLALENPQNQAVIATAGGILPLMQLLWPGSPTEVKKAAAWALRALAALEANRAAIIAAPGATPAVLRKLRLAP
jgi:HEAT repeat protein